MTAGSLGELVLGPAALIEDAGKLVVARLALELCFDPALPHLLEPSFDALELRGGNASPPRLDLPDQLFGSLRRCGL
jgi:hypothetical protein